MYWFKLQIEWLIKSFQYAWFLREDRDWDYAHLLILMAFKLKRMEKCIREGHHLLRERDAKDIRIAICLIKRLTGDEYSKYAEPEVISAIDKMLETDEIHPGIHLSKTLTEQEGKALRRGYKRQHARRVYDMDYLFRHLRRKIERWWV